MNKGYIVGLLLVLLPVISFAQSAWPEPQAHAGTFRQTKHIAVLTRPFVSSGRYQFTPESGLLWHTLLPVANQLSITDKGVFRVSGEGQQEALTTDQGISQLLLALISGDQKKLNMMFRINTHESGMLLTPTDSTIGNLFEKIELTRDQQQLLHIVLHEPAGNYTEITLHPR